VSLRFEVSIDARAYQTESCHRSIFSSMIGNSVTAEGQAGCGRWARAVSPPALDCDQITSQRTGGASAFHLAADAGTEPIAPLRRKALPVVGQILSGVELPAVRAHQLDREQLQKIGRQAGARALVPSGRSRAVGHEGMLVLPMLRAGRREPIGIEALRVLVH